VDKLSECWSFIDKNRIENYLRAVDDLIDQNFSEPTFGVTQIAEHLNLTPSYASKLYKDASGIILIDRLSAKRSETAEYLLSHTKVPLSNIYRMAGYSSNNYFYRVFRKRHGITPLEYRNQEKARNKA
jgi:YesN/AraC family two-component response regulator